MSEVLENRELPTWFDDAKFGVFIHWGPSAVPAYAPPGPSPFDLAETHGWEYSFANTPYAEWYRNSMELDGPTKEHHEREWGGRSYEAFGERFNAVVEAWDPEAWAELFAASGVNYVVLITKHHDGFLLWPSATPNPFLSNWGSERDLVGELADAVRARGMRFGTYYSGGFDWTFEGLPIDSFAAFLEAIPQSHEYLAYADAHWRELIDRYEPCVMWNDIGYPASADLEQLFTDYFERVPDGVVNNRFDFLRQSGGMLHADFVTPEYTSTFELLPRKWEMCRGIGTSFGYNRAEHEADFESETDLLHSLIDVVAHGGNLLLDVGPAADGSISFPQVRRLLAIGSWLRTNGESLVATRPWTRQTGTTAEGIDVRFTARDDTVYAILLGDPGTVVTIDDLDAPAVGEVTLLGRDMPLRHRRDGAAVTIELVDPPATAPAHVLRFEPS